MNWGKNVHCGLIVSCAGENWLCDPGYLLMTPLKLREVPQSIYRNQTSGVKLNFEGGRFYLSTFRGKKEKWRYSFRNIPCERDKFVKYWLKSFEQPGMNGICLTRQENGSMVYIHNNFIKEVNSHKISKRRVHGNWLGEIRQYFSIPRRFLEEACGITQERRQQ
jgi:arylamine N-acetyltransferase